MNMFQIMASVIIGMVVLVLLVFFLGASKASLRDVSDSSICKESVKLNARLRFDKLMTETEIKCPTLFIELDKKQANNEKAVFNTLALALTDTWDEFLEGKEEIFNTATEDYCVVRRVVEFDDKAKHEGFFDYLLQHNPPNIKKPYFTYLTNVDVTKDVAIANSNIELRKSDVIDTSTPYAAVFIMSKKENIGKVLGAQMGAAAGGTLGLVGGLGIVYVSGGFGVVEAAQLTMSGIGAGTMAGGSLGFLLGSEYPANWASAMVLIPYTQENLNSLNCTKLPVSVVQTEKAAG